MSLIIIGKALLYNKKVVLDTLAPPQEANFYTQKYFNKRYSSSSSFFPTSIISSKTW